MRECEHSFRRSYSPTGVELCFLILPLLLATSAFPAAAQHPGSGNPDFMCGPHSLFLAAKASGVETSLNRITKVAGTTPRDGTSVQGMIDAARVLGLRAQVIRASLDDLRRDPRRAILVLDENTHFAFVKDIRRGGISIVEALHLRHLSEAELGRRWDGLAIMVGRVDEPTTARTWMRAFRPWLVAGGSALLIAGAALVVSCAARARVQQTQS